MNYTHMITACCMLAAIAAPAAVGQEPDSELVSGAAATEKPIIAVPLFANRTTTQTSRIAPGTYKSKAKYEATVNLDVDANAKNSRYIDEMNVEYADGEWQLPDEACEIATDAAAQSIAATRRFRVLSRSTPALKAVDSEIAYQGTAGTPEATQLFSSLKSCNAKYLLLGRLTRFRVDRTEGVAYGVERRQIVTSVSIDMQLVDVNTMDIIAGETSTERIVVRLPEGITTHTAVYDWEPVMREAVSRCVVKFLGKMTTSASAPDELGPAAPIVDLQVSSIPEGADVEFNGDFVGNTPCTISVPAETGVITISAPGYEKWVKRIKPSSNLKIAPKLKEEKAAPAPVTPPAKGMIIID